MVVYNNIKYDYVKQSDTKGICKGCAFSRTLRNDENKDACSKYGMNCKTNNNGDMLIYVKSKNQDIVFTKDRKHYDQSQLSLF